MPTLDEAYYEKHKSN